MNPETRGLTSEERIKKLKELETERASIDAAIAQATRRASQLKGSIREESIKNFSDLNPETAIAAFVDQYPIIMFPLGLETRF